MIILIIKILRQKSLCQTIGFVFEKLLKDRASIFSGRLHRAQTDEVKALNLTVFMFSIYLFYITGYGLNSHYHDTATERNQHCC